MELDIFSGVENPKWTLLPSDANFASVKEELAWASSSQIPARAGYRGFLVRTEMTDGTITLKKFGQGLQNSTALEMLLLQSYADNLDPLLVYVAIDGINGQVCYSAILNCSLLDILHSPPIMADMPNSVSAL